MKAIVVTDQAAGTAGMKLETTMLWGAVIVASGGPASAVLDVGALSVAIPVR